MAIRYDALLVRALAREIGDQWTGMRAVELALDPARRIVRLLFEGETSLVALLHPEAGHLFAETEQPAMPAGNRFRRLFLTAVEAPPDDRRIDLVLSDAAGRERHRLVLELATNQWNALLLDPPEGERSPVRIRAVLHPRDSGDRRLRVGAPYSQGASDRDGLVEPVSREVWLEALASAPPGERRSIALRRFAPTSAINIGWVLGEALEEPAGGPALEAAYDRYRALAEVRERQPDMPADAKGRWLLARPRGEQPYVSALEESDARRCDSLLDGMREAARRSGALADFLERAGVSGPGGAALGATAQELETLGKALAARRRRLRKRRAALRRQLDEAGDPERPRDIGHLLLARLQSVPRGAERVELEGFDGSPRVIRLDPALDPPANAEAYFAEAARRERALRKLPDEISKVEDSLAEVDAALATLVEEGPSDASWEIAGGRPPAPSKRGQRAGRRPYLRLRSSGGLEIRVGRSGRSNDELTFHHSSPEDIWMHARQTKGAHVVLRWGRRDENPPRRDLLEAAVAAAVHSGARHSGTAAVDWTRRKYVRKPRKSPPGTVTLDRVQTLFVEPDEELVRRMKLEE